MKRLGFLSLVVVFSLNLVFFSALASSDSPVSPYDEAKILAEIFTHIQKDYLNQIDLTQCRYVLLKQISGQNEMLQEGEKEQPCLDEFSSYLTPTETKDIEAWRAGRFSGIGIRFKGENGKLLITEIKKNSPAEKAKILRGDEVIFIRQDGETESFQVKGATVLEIMGRISGLNGTTVFLTIKRGEDLLPIFAIERGDIKIETIRAKKVSDDILYIHLSTFNKESANDVETVIRDFQKINASGGVVLDFRDNGGGVLLTAEELLYALARNPDDIMVTTRSRSKKESIRVKDRDGVFTFPGSITFKNFGTLSAFQLVVLINIGSASASEIVAGTLQDWGRARVVGEPSFGKGFGQTLYKLSDGSMLKLTTFEFLVGNEKRSIHNTGVTPDLEVLWQKRKDQTYADFLKEYTVAFGDPEKDPQLKKAIEILTQ